MFVLFAIVIVEIASIFVVSSVNPQTVPQVKNSISHIFPAVFAQDATGSAIPSEIPTDQASPTDTSQPSPSGNSTLNPTESPTEMPQASSETPPKNNATGSAAAPQNQPQGNETVVLDESQQQAQEASQAVITGNDMISGPVENIDDKVEQEAAAQDQKLEQTKTPEEKATLSINFAQESVKSAERSLKKDDIQTTAYVVQRISDQIDAAASNAQKSNNPKVLQNLSGFCQQADFSLRTQQLAVSEEMAQDFEIVRGKCLNITQ